MNPAHISLIREAITKRVNPLKDSVGDLRKYPISVVLRCVELGDVDALAVWTSRARAENKLSSGEIELVVAAEHVLEHWRTLEETNGRGALLDHRHCLKSSPAEVIGLDRIENAERFQKLNSRIPGDPFWAIDFRA